VFAAIVSITMVCFLAWMYLNRQLPIIRNSQTGQLAAYCVGCAVLQGSWVVYIGEVSAASCMARPWLASVAYSLMIGALLRKMYSTRLHLLDTLAAGSGSSTSMKLIRKISSVSSLRRASKSSVGLLVKRIRRHQLFFDQHPAVIIATCVSVDVVLCLAWLLVSPLRPHPHYAQIPWTTSSLQIEDYFCNSKQGSYFLILLALYKCLQTIAAVVLSFRLRSLGELL
jgi:hypothetical protein